MARRRTMWTVLTVCWLLLLGIATPARADYWEGENFPKRQIDSLGWVMTFDLGAHARGRIGATFQYMLKFVDSNQDYDLMGTVHLQCPQRYDTGAYRCDVPDMPQLIRQASGGTVDLTLKQLPPGELKACGKITTSPGKNEGSTGLGVGVSIIETPSYDLYGLQLNDNNLVLTHGRDQTEQEVGLPSQGFYLKLPNTTLIAPPAYELDLRPHIANHYTIEELTVVDPGAFANRLIAGC